MDQPLGAGEPDRGEPAEAESLAEAITETIREPILVLDSDLRIQRANRAFFQTFQSSPEEAIGRPVFELGAGEWDIPELRRLLNEVLPRDESFEGYEVETAFPDLGLRIMELNARRLAPGAAREPMILLAIEDVTERRRMEQDLRRSNRELEEFAYVASHDLQEPLRMVSSFVQLLDDRYGDRLDEDGREFIAYAVDGARRMKRLIDDLLSYSRVGRKDREMGAVDCEEVLQEVLDSLQRRLEDSGTRVTHGDLPMIRGSRTELSRLLQNLIENAAEHAESADGKVHVHVSSERSGPWHRIIVEDDGPGIPPDDQDRIFEIFQRLESAEGREGTGMGLAICRKIAEQHGGRIWVESEPGEGAAFHVELPATTAGTFRATGTTEEAADE